MQRKNKEEGFSQNEVDQEAAAQERKFNEFTKMYDGIDPPTETEEELAKIVDEDRGDLEYWEAKVKQLKLENDKRAQKWSVEVDPQ